MNRRNFLGAVAGLTSVGLVDVTLSSSAPPPLSSREDAFRALTEDLMRRLCRGCRGRPSLTVVDSTADGLVQWHTAVEVATVLRRDGSVDYETFRRQTAWWHEGPLSVTRRPKDSPARRFGTVIREMSRIAELALPYGVEWTAACSDDATGLKMRVISSYAIEDDEWLLRYDVLVGP